jgi:site-specific recombinase XerD
MDTLWHLDPARAYADWQTREAAGADRRPFSQQSIVQHRAMFDRFHRYLVARGATLASFGADVLDGFWLDGDAAHYSPATRMRYLKLIDRLCRHLVAIGVRDANPASDLVLGQHWPVDDPDVLFLPQDVDRALQEFVRPQPDDDPATLQKRAIVALFLGTGVTASEGRAARMQDLNRTRHLRISTRGAAAESIPHHPSGTICGGSSERLAPCPPKLASRWRPPVLPQTHGHADHRHEPWQDRA